MKETTENLSPAVHSVNEVSEHPTFKRYYLLIKSLPVEDVEESVKAKSGDVVRGDVFNQSDFIKHNYLRNKSD